MATDTAPVTWRERFALALLCIAALWIRIPGLSKPFDREFGGHANAFFAIAAVNYEREGAWKHAGYPSVRIDGPAIVSDDVVGTADDDAASVYVNHPPTVALLAWASAHAFGPAGWSERWRDGLPPIGIESALRMPFLALHVLGLVALWWATRPALGGRAALVAVAFAGLAPVGVTYGPLVNYENAAMPFVLVTLGAWIRHARDGSLRMLLVAACASFFGGCITWAPLAFAAAIAVDAAFRRRWRLSLRAALVIGGAAAIPLAAHVLLARASGAVRENVLDRVPVVFGPVAENPLLALAWLRLQLGYAVESIGAVQLALAALALLVWTAQSWRERARAHLAGLPRAEPAFEAAPLVLGALVYLLAFHRHTIEPQRMFQLALLPGVAVCAAAGVEALRGRRSALRTALAAALVLVVAGESVARTRSIQRAMHAPGAFDGPGGDASIRVPLPTTAGAGIARATPKGWIALIPPATGLNLAAGYYAWRNVVVAAAPSALAEIRAGHPSSRAQRACALVPMTPESDAVESSAAFERGLPADATWRSTAGGWRIWWLP
ncbi:MAG: glycosyltransferase family 39 protein [Planctomycetota bacterium]|nr:glycosyltransferase family 39 protein [Planctomycetota bacterium]